TEQAAGGEPRGQFGDDRGPGRGVVRRIEANGQIGGAAEAGGGFAAGFGDGAGRILGGRERGGERHGGSSAAGRVRSIVGGRGCRDFDPDRGRPYDSQRFVSR